MCSKAVILVTIFSVVAVSVSEAAMFPGDEITRAMHKLNQFFSILLKPDSIPKEHRVRYADDV